jgi:hypothetical protein
VKRYRNITITPPILYCAVLVSPTTVNSAVPVAFVIVGGKVKPPARFADNCEAFCCCVGSSGPEKL